MKKIIIALILSAGIYGCATTGGQSSQAKFDTDNYQQNIVNSVEYADNFANFESQNIPEAKLESQDFSILLQADLAFNQGAYAIAAPAYYDLAMKYKDPRIIYKGIVSYQHSENNRADTSKLNSLVNLLVSVAPNSNISKLYSIPVDLNQGNYEVAINNLNSLIAQSPDKAGSVLLFVSTLLSTNNYPLSSDVVTKFGDYVVNKYSKFPESLLLASVAYNDAQLSDKLLKTLSLIYKKYPSWELPIFWNAGLLVSDNSANLLEQVIKQDMSERKNPSANMQNLYVSVMVKLNKLNEANSYIESSAGYKEQNGNMLVNKAVIDYKLGNVDSAIQTLKLADQKDYSLNGTVDFALGTLSVLKNDRNTAIKYFKSAASANPTLAPIAGVGVIRSYVAESNFAAVDKYIESMGNAVGTPKPRDLLITKLSIYCQLKQYDYGYKLAVKHSKEYSTDKAFMYLYASLTGLTGHTKQAIELYKKYIKLNPKDAGGYNDLAYILADKTTNYKEAMTYAKKAYDLSPNDSAILDTIGWASFKLKQYPQAEEYLVKSYQTTQDTDTANHLKQVYLAEGKTDEANKINILTQETVGDQVDQQLVDQSMLILMYYQFGADFGK